MHRTSDHIGVTVFLSYNALSVAVVYEWKIIRAGGIRRQIWRRKMERKSGRQVERSTG
jgi:hypothetical protein